jgi:glycine hydroxymethyltransferase
MQWWPHMNTIAWITVALKEVESEDFKNYAKQALINAQVMAEEFLKRWYKLVTWWTDNHMIILDLSDKSYNWADVENALDKIGISVSKSLIPNDTRPPFRPSWVRIGTPAMTTRWVKENDIKKIVEFIDKGIIERENNKALESLKEEVKEFSMNFLM